MPEIDHLSPSQINMFLRCPKQWEFRYVKGLKIPPSGAMVLGSAYHEGIAEHFRYIMNNNDDPDPMLAIDTFDTSFERIRSEHIVKDEEDEIPFDEIVWDEEPGRLKDLGVFLLKLYQIEVAPEILPLNVEHKEVMIINDIPIHTVIDLEDTEAVIDHKVKSRRFSEDDLKKDIQATAYWMAKGKLLDFHVALKTKTPAIEIQPTQRNGMHEKFFYQQVTKVWEAVHSGIFPPNDQGWHCSERWCGYWQMCKGGHNE